MSSFNTKMCKKSLKLGLDVLINSHCNLNCKYCNRKAPISDPLWYNIEQFEKDISDFKNNGFEIDNLTFTGGEPLLNKNLDQYFKITRKYYPDCFLKVFTNGKLLQNDSRILKTIKDNNVFVLYTQYILSDIDYKKVFDNLKKYEIQYQELYEHIFYKKDYKWLLSYTPLSKEPKSDIEAKKQFDCCYSDCLCIKNGILYICGEIANIQELNKAFGTNYQLKENSDFFIINTLKPETLYNALGNPINFCKYCNKTHVKNFKWEKSSKDKSEWILE